MSLSQSRIKRKIKSYELFINTMPNPSISHHNVTMLHIVTCPTGAPELRKKKGLPPPKELSKAKQASLSISSSKDHHHHPNSVGDRPKVVHIKAKGGCLENDAEHEYDASSSSSGSVDSGRISMKGSYDEHATDVSLVGGSSRKHDHFSHPTSDDFDQDHNYAGFGKKKKPRIVGAASSDEDSSTKKDSALTSPPISDSASLLYALATTCAEQVPSMESPPVSGQEDTPSEQRLVTPETGRGSSRRLWSDRHQHSGAASASMGTSYPSYASLTSSAALTASDSLRLEKEKAVQSFLITSLPCIYMDDVRDYTKRLVNDGFDSLQMLTEQLEENDLDFMKKAHKRALLQVLRKETRVS